MHLTFGAGPRMSFFRPRHLVGVLFLLLGISSAPAARAQSETTAFLQSRVRAELHPRIAEADSLLEFQTKRLPRARVDVDAGVVRAAYRIRYRTLAPDPAQAATEYLQASAAQYGLDPALDDLHLAEVRRTPHSAHVVFQQMVDDVPVLRRQIKVNLDRDLQPTMVVSGYAPHLRGAIGLRTRPTIDEKRAVDLARNALTEPATAGEATLAVHADRHPLLVWQVIVWPTSDAGEIEVLVDAHSGAIASIRSTGVHSPMRTGKSGAPMVPSAMVAAPPTVVEEQSVAVVQRADGSGLVFDPDPVTAAGVEYGGAYVDNNDADSEALNGMRTEVALRDVAQGTDGLYRLEGPYVRIVGSGVGQAYSPPAESDPHAFRYTRAHPGFEAVMAYYHIDAGTRYVESLDAGTPSPQQIRVNPRGYTADNSEYLPFQHAIIFGTGGVDDAEDGSVVRHEHAHAILNNTTPGLLSTSEGAAFHEGWADYWATSMLRHQVESGEVPPRDWTHVFPWDGNNPSISWCGRYLNHPGRYPDQMSVSPPSGCGSYPVLYQHGLLWATTLMEIYAELGRETTDRLNLASHGYLNAPVTMADAAEALIQADIDLYGGVHTGVLIGVLGARGFVDASEYGPVIAHDGVPYRETPGGTARVEVVATGTTAEIDSVIVHYGSVPDFSHRLILELEGTGLWLGDLPLPNSPDTVQYYIEAVDVLGRRSFLPENAPHDVFLAAVGPDLLPPEIEHTPISRSSVAAWPASVVARVEDVLGVDSVWVTYAIHDSTGVLVDEGRFDLRPEGTFYQALFPTPVASVEPGMVVSYRVYARDQALASNVASAPEDGWYVFPITLQGVLREYDFESTDPSIVAGGIWERGVPTFGVQVARSGQGVWGTNLTGAYPAASQRSSLLLPALNLQTLGQTYLVFWHWHDFEHNGQAVPDSMKQIQLWDGGNVKLSTDGGATWQVAVPESGYNGTIAVGLENPLAGEPAFGGYSFGWRRVVVPLPNAPDVRVRFDFGTDVSNQDVARAYAGWYLDDVAVVTEITPDVQPPQASTTLPPEMLRGPADIPPRATVWAVDDVGIARADVLYEVYPATGAPFEGQLRMAMSDTSLHHFQAALPALPTTAAGDRLEFRMRLRDYAGNEVYVPARSEAPIRVLYRTLVQMDVGDRAVASGLWSRVTGGFEGRASPERPRSSIVLPRIDLPINAETIAMRLRHRYVLRSGVGGNVKISLDDGASWDVLQPEEGYTGTLSSDGANPLAGEPVFTGSVEELHPVSFDLTPYAGRQVQLRIDLGSSRPMASDERWLIAEPTILYATEDPDFQIPRTLALHANYPDPFFSTTLIGYTLPSASHLRLEVFDMLGRRVSVLFDGHQEAGTFEAVFDGSRLAAGTYLLRLRAGGQQRVEPLIIVR